ncbi:MAG TPA: FtsX-like permease family protein [Vicinamibacterales bacterium]|jgi:putative ABC transport system permease protein|nr:FtsX-like permease family protein [Vicinamibacterales bacterium]
MKFVGLVLKSARRSKRRTFLTVMSVAIAVFLFASLRAVLDGFNAATEASSSTRIITQRSTSLFFSMPTSHAEVIRNTPGVQDVTWASWFGGVYKDPQNFFAQFAVEPESYLRLYPEVLLTPEERKAFLEDRTACIVGDGLAKRYGFKVGDKISLQVGIPVYGTKDFDYNVRGIYRSGGAAVDNQSMMFHWKYADERSLQPGLAGWFIAQIANPDRATEVASAIDGKFANSPNETKTETEKAFQSTFVSMFGNLNLLLGSIALAVVITTLFVSANTMAMSVRERTTEIAVMRTLGFRARTIFLLVAGEGLVMAVVGGAIGGLLARAIVNPDILRTGGFIPDMRVNYANMLAGLALSALIGVLAGLIPATMASRLKIVDALRRVA